jgi:hypothetical protein
VSTTQCAAPRKSRRIIRPPGSSETTCAATILGAAGGSAAAEPASGPCGGSCEVQIVAVPSGPDAVVPAALRTAWIRTVTHRSLPLQ